MKNGDLITVETLIIACTDLEARDNENMTALETAYNLTRNADMKKAIKDYLNK